MSFFGYAIIVGVVIIVLLLILWIFGVISGSAFVITFLVVIILLLLLLIFWAFYSAGKVAKKVCVNESCTRIKLPVDIEKTNELNGYYYYDVKLDNLNNNLSSLVTNYKK